MSSIRSTLSLRPLQWALLAFGALISLASAGLAIERPPRQERLAQCKADVGTGKTACYPTILPGSKFTPASFKYGWYVGKGHPSDESNPPPYTKLLNGIDQCAWIHDRGGWRWNPRTKVCEHQFMCANTVGLFRCLEAYQPESPEETEAKRVATSGFASLAKGCISRLYKAYAHEFQRDAHGSQWLSDKALNEASEAFGHCKPLQPLRGFEAELARLKRGPDFKPLKN